MFRTGGGCCTKIELMGAAAWVNRLSSHVTTRGEGVLPTRTFVLFKIYLIPISGIELCVGPGRSIKIVEDNIRSLISARDNENFQLLKFIKDTIILI